MYNQGDAVGNVRFDVIDQRAIVDGAMDNIEPLRIVRNKRCQKSEHSSDSSTRLVLDAADHLHRQKVTWPWMLCWE